MVAFRARARRVYPVTYQSSRGSKSPGCRRVPLGVLINGTPARKTGFMKMPGRNDARAALAYYTALVERDGSVGGDKMATLVRLQDDPTAFLDLVAARYPEPPGFQPAPRSFTLAEILGEDA